MESATGNLNTIKIKKPPVIDWRLSVFKIKLGSELFSQGATPQLSSPLYRFTSEFGMGQCGSNTPLPPSKAFRSFNTLKAAYLYQNNLFHFAIH
jgi:hypothetical protein